MWAINGKLTDDESEVMKAFNLKYPPMVKSPLDTDQYKKSMKQAYLHQFSGDHATWDFKARNVGDAASHEKYTAEDREEIKNQIRAYCALRYTKEELAFLGDPVSRPWIHNNFIEVERDWKPHFEDFEIEDDPISGLAVHTKGVQWKISDYEIPVLEIAAETYYRNHYDYEKLAKDFKEKTEEKLRFMREGIYAPGIFSEFGARRRVSFELQDWLIGRLVEEKKHNAIGPIQGFIGTSNMYLAMKYGVTAVGTMAHEFIMTVGQGHLYHNPAYSNWFALDAWVKEYGTMNGIALTDTIGTDVFLKDFRKTFATLFSGVRHDSGDPYAWGDKMIAHYKSLGIDPLTKTLMFSDSLNLQKATEINKYFKGKAKVAFGIGTDWSGPQGIEALNIVCKVAIVNGLDVAKLSDAPGKNMCRNPEAIERLHKEIDWRMTYEK
jgi:nicotinate phosphoribosyltransferase